MSSAKTAQIPKRIALIKTIDSYRGRERRILQFQCAAIIRGSEFNDSRSACIVNVSGCKIRAHQNAVEDDKLPPRECKSWLFSALNLVSAVLSAQEKRKFFTISH